MRRHRGSPVSSRTGETPDPDWTIIDSALAMLISISTGYNWACWFFDGTCPGWQFSWQLQLTFSWASWLMRKYLPLAVIGVPLERAISLATAMLPSLSLRWLCPDLWMALLLLYRLGLVLPPRLAARLTELRAARMQSCPDRRQPDQQIYTAVVNV